MWNPRLTDRGGLGMRKMPVVVLHFSAFGLLVKLTVHRKK